MSLCHALISSKQGQSKGGDRMEQGLDVVVVGAGMAGLRTASLLKSQGVAVQVLEARDRVGGRAFAKEVYGHFWDLGGQWIGPQQSRMLALMKELKIPTIPQEEIGNTVFITEEEGKRVYGGVYPPAFALCIQKLDEMAAQLPQTRPWEAKKAKEWDSMTVESWIKQEFKPEDGVTADHTGLRGILASEPNEVSLLFWLSYINKATSRDLAGRLLLGTVGVLANTEGGAQQDKVVGSVWGLANQLYRQQLEKEVTLNSPVREIKQNKDGCVVTTWDDRQFHARRVVVAMSPPMAGRIRFNPPLPTLKDVDLQRHAMAAVIKTVLFYRDDFWRQRGYNGLAIISDEKGGQLTYDACTKLKDGTRQAAIVVFFLGKAARKWSERKEERKEAAMETVHRLFDDESKHERDALTKLVHYEEMDWCSEEWSRGGYCGVAPPGLLTTVGSAIWEPCNRIHWAGTETAMEWPGYFEGACESAERVTTEILKAEQFGRGLTKANL